VLHAEPGSRIFAGLNRGVDRTRFERALRDGTVAESLHQFEPRPGECLLVPAGTVHALGEGLVVAEVQQSSDTTYRLFDWDRLGPDGQRRPLHIEQALAVIDFQRGPVVPERPAPAARNGRTRLVACEKFVMDRWELHSPRTVGGDQRFHLLAVLEGSLQIDGDPAAKPLRKGQTALLPAAANAVRLEPLPAASVLDIYLP